ncbi:MAG: DUF6624 domain-containing protein [Bacteroidota bacterium]
MTRNIRILVSIILFFGCKQQSDKIENNDSEVVFNQNVVNELEAMVVLDQVAANIPQGQYLDYSTEEWQKFKDSVFTAHQKRLKEIFDQFGFIGYDIAGESGSYNFWLMVQHCDHDPDFQMDVLEKMKKEVENENADPSNFAYLTDRVNLNTGKAQIYGTQVEHNFEIAQAYPKKLLDSAHVNERRKSVGLEPLEEYLNFMSISNFEMNKEYYLNKGINEPTLYKIEPNQ